MLNTVSSTKDPNSHGAPRRQPHPATADAERLRARVAHAGRWFSDYLAVIGIVSAVWIVALETLVPDGLPRGVVAGTWPAFIVLSSAWAERHAAYPAGATRYLWVAFGAWLVAYVLVVGPVVRGLFGDAVAPWAIAAAAMSLPFFAAAGLLLRRR